MSSGALPSAELRKWDGERGICNIKNKKKMRFVGREMQPSATSKIIIKAPWTFRGSEAIPSDWPMENINLWPIKKGNRTIFN